MSTDKENKRDVSVEATSASADEGASDVFTPENDIFSHETEAMLPALARRSVETFVRERRVIAPPPVPGSSILLRKAACFVSIKTNLKELRGCIGTIEPYHETLAEELIANAVSAATRDPRFPPVAEAELPRLRYSVDVLSDPEPTRFEDLDPSNFGVIVEDETGARRGLLLPDIEGIETASQQVEIAARKAGIMQGTPLKLFRFRVRRFGEGTHFRQNSEQGANQ
ncbi:MAG TPA: AmmeMemoRadiSam system protein A [Pyrinomonadaceae bacterium]|jgi:AmmeMemoRadiSam system protein A